MAEYIEREATCGDCIHAEICKHIPTLTGFSTSNTAYCKAFKNAADVVPVVHGRWEEHDESSDDYWHHKCTNCNVDAPFDYKYREDWDEGMDGEWYPIGLVEDGIIEHITPFCPNCGAKMDLK